MAEDTNDTLRNPRCTLHITVRILMPECSKELIGQVGVKASHSDYCTDQSTFSRNRFCLFFALRKTCCVLRPGITDSGQPAQKKRGFGMEITYQYQKFLQVYQKSQCVFEEGSYGNEMFIVHSGRIRLSRKTREEEVELATLGPKEFFGEMALVENIPRSATASAMEDNTQLIALDKDKFLYMVSHQPAFAFTIMRALCQRIRTMNERLRQME